MCSLNIIQEFTELISHSFCEYLAVNKLFVIKCAESLLTTQSSWRSVRRQSCYGCGFKDAVPSAYLKGINC